jgi:Tfp pilus assembly protein FimT
MGFTLTELLVVMFMISLLGLIVVPHIEIVKYRMDGSVRGVASALLVAQRSAVKQQHDVVVAFDVANNRLRIHEDANNNGVVDTDERIRYISLQSGVRFGLGPATPLGSALSTLSFTETQGGLPAVRFIRDGSASEEGTFYLTSVRAVADDRFARDARAVHVSRATGRVTWFYFAPPEWKPGF